MLVTQCRQLLENLNVATASSNRRNDVKTEHSKKVIIYSFRPVQLLR